MTLPAEPRNDAYARNHFPTNARSVDVTDDMADRAHQAWHTYVWGPDEPLTHRDLGITRQAWKVALRAALNPPESL